MICQSCGKFINEENPVYCPHCGLSLTPEVFDEIHSSGQPSSQPQAETSTPIKTTTPIVDMYRYTYTTRPSTAWYLAPILFAIIGGLIGYVAVRDRDEEMAKSLLIIGIVITGLAYFLSLALL